MYVCMYVCMYICMCMYVYVCVCMCMCVYVYIRLYYTSIHKNADIDTDQYHTCIIPRLPHEQVSFAVQIGLF